MSCSPPSPHPPTSSALWESPGAGVTASPRDSADVTRDARCGLALFDFFVVCQGFCRDLCVFFFGEDRVGDQFVFFVFAADFDFGELLRSEEHTSELQS